MAKNLLFDRNNIQTYSLKDRESRICIQKNSIDPYTYDTNNLPESTKEEIAKIATQIFEARTKHASVILAFGAHTIKNGLGFLLGELVRKGWVTHLATNGAGIIHDWEFAYFGKSSENVKENIKNGTFGLWEETGLAINLALAVGAYRGLGYGASIGALITENGLVIPDMQELEEIAKGYSSSIPSSYAMRAAAIDLIELIESLQISQGRFYLEHPFQSYSAQAIAYSTNIPCTGHPMFGHDIIYCHKANRGSCVGRTSERDFLSFAHSVSDLEGGVYISVGSAVMSPMIFEKSLSIARNVKKQKGEKITDCDIHVVDIQPSAWDWSQGEPTIDNPAYYLRFLKTFSRMGCRMHYHLADNRDFLVCLCNMLNSYSL